MAAPTTTDPVLTLTTLTERAHVQIDGRNYHLRNVHQLGLEGTIVLDAEYLPYRKAIQRLQKAPDKMTPKDAADLAKRLHRLVPIILDAPAEVIAGLSDLDRMSIVNAFQRGFRSGPTGSETQQKRGRRSTGRKSSRVSPASTEATP